MAKHQSQETTPKHAHLTTLEREYPKFTARIRLRIPAGRRSKTHFLRKQAGSHNMSPCRSGTSETPSCCEHVGNCACCEHDADPEEHVAAQAKIGIRALMPTIKGPPGDTSHYPTQDKGGAQMITTRLAVKVKTLTKYIVKRQL